MIWLDYPRSSAQSVSIQEKGRTIFAQAAARAINTSSFSSSSDTPQFSLPPYSPGNGHGALSLSPITLLNPCVLASTDCLGILLLDATLSASPSGEGVGGAVLGLGVAGVGVEARAEGLERVRVLGAEGLGTGVATAVCALRFRGLRAMPWWKGWVGLQASLDSAREGRWDVFSVLYSGANDTRGLLTSLRI